MVRFEKNTRVLGGSRTHTLPCKVSCCVVLVLCLAFALAGCARQQMPSPMAAGVQKPTDAEARALQEAVAREHLGRAPWREASYRIGPNDTIDIRVFRDPEFNTTARVDGQGFIRFPPLGKVEVAGLTERELETLLQDRLRDKYIKDPHVTVFVTEPHMREVSIFGAVGSPGRYPLVGEMRLLDLLSLAGGIATGAGNVAYVIRYDTPTTGTQNPAKSDDNPAGQRITIDLDGLLMRGERYWNIPLWPGDLVNVPVPEPGWIHVTGLGIVRPGTYPLITFLGLQGREVSPTGAATLVPYPLTRSSKTLRQAVDEAGGLKFEASRKILIFRQGEDSRDEFIPVNYRKILKDTRNDVPLQTRDTVIVNRHPIRYPVAVIGRIAEQIIRFTIYAEYDLFNENRGGGRGGGGQTITLEEPR